MPAIGIFSVKYSPNLGDGLLSECLEMELRAACAGLTTVALELAGRDRYGPAAPNRKLALHVLERLPRWLRRIATRAALERLVRFKLQPRWRDKLAGCDAVVVGGGNLFADADLNFPIKVKAALELARNHDLPVAVFGVGVSRNWSAAGTRMFRKGLAGTRLVHAAVRDERSRDSWIHYLGAEGDELPGVVRDPGLLASLHFRRGEPSADGKLIALGITDPVAVRYHAPFVGTQRLGDWYGATIRALVNAGFRVRLFTNGSPEDREYLRRHAAGWSSAESVSVEPPFDTPADLARFVSGCDVVIAHRMHACITAHSFAVPTIGLAWDVKLKSFFESVGRADYLVDPEHTSPDRIVALVLAAQAEGVDPVSLAATIAETRADVVRLGQALSRAVAGGLPGS